jgi:hypothetical protein
MMRISPAGTREAGAIETIVNAILGHEFETGVVAPACLALECMLRGNSKNMSRRSCYSTTRHIATGTGPQETAAKICPKITWRRCG